MILARSQGRLAAAAPSPPRIQVGFSGEFTQPPKASAVVVPSAVRATAPATMARQRMGLIMGFLLDQLRKPYGEVRMNRGLVAPAGKGEAESTAARAPLVGLRV